MATKQSSQKFIARNRVPCVQIKYDEELYGAQKKVQIPFVMGVMSDLCAANAGDLPPIDDFSPAAVAPNVDRSQSCWRRACSSTKRNRASLAASSRAA